MLTPLDAPGCCRTWCGGSRAVTPCLSSCCNHDFVISVNFSKSLKFRDRRGFTSLVSGSFHSRITDTYWYAFRISRRTPKAHLICGVHAGASGSHASKSSGLSRLSRGFIFGSLAQLRRRFPGRYTPDYLSRARPSLRVAPWLPLLLSLLRQWVRSTAGAAILYLLSNPDVGGLPSVSPGPSVVSLTDPPLTRPPHSRDSGGSHLVCVQRDPH